MEQPTSDGSARARKVGRFVLVLGMLVGAVVGGLYLGQYLLGVMVDQGKLARAASALGIAAVLGLVKEGLGLVPGVLAYLKTGKGEGLYRLCGFVVIAVATVTVSVPTFTGSGPGSGGAPVVQAATAANHVLFLSRRGETTIVVPFFQEAELCAPLGTCEEGLTLDDSTARFVEQLVDGLVECGSLSRPVALEVRGFASSSKFVDRDDSDELNLKTANLRGESIVEAIGRRVEAMEEARTARASLDLRAVSWSSFETMTRAAGFNDHDSDGVYSELRGLLNRRAEITLLDPAGCEVAG